MSRPEGVQDGGPAGHQGPCARWINLISDGDVDAMSRPITPSWRMYGGPPGLPTGPEGLHVLFATIGPIDQKWTMDDVVAEGDRVVVRATCSCEQESFFGVLARGTRQIFTATFVFRIEDGLIAEVWRNADDLGRLLQLGARIEPGSG
jgi:hypothetical protein